MDFDEFEDYYEEDYDDWDPEEEFSCDNCGPWCQYWLGDGLCELEIERQTEEFEDYTRKHVREAECPVCGKKLKMYDVKAENLWEWDPSWYDPMIALTIYRAYSVPKGVIHGLNNIFHIWIGEGETYEEKLIRLIRES